jgi:nitroreductase
MELQDVIRRRRMVREFDPDRPVPRAALERIVGNATRAPSAGFAQGHGFLVLDTPEDRATFWDVTNRPGQREATGSPSMHTAPAIIIPFAHKQAYLDRYAQPDKGFAPDDDSRWRIPHWYVDTAFAAMVMLLTVVDEELGAIFFSIRDPEPLCEAFGIPGGFDPIGALALGYPAPNLPTGKRGDRRDTDEVIHWGRWTTPA